MCDTTEETEFYVVQVDMAVGGGPSIWRDTPITSIPEWEMWRTHPDRVIGHVAGVWWSEKLAFKSGEVAMKLMSELMVHQIGQSMRLVKRKIVVTESEIFLALRPRRIA